MTVYQTEWYQAHLALILDHPEADLPRLVLADRLEENGEDERAEFIRVQCELWNRRRGPAGQIPEDSPYLVYDAGYQRMRHREEKLLAVNWHDWSGRVGTFCGNFHDHTQGAVGVTFRRGFVAEVFALLATLIGWECPVCWGSTEEGSGHVYANCPTCHGTGHTPGLLPRLVREQPIEVVRVTDREPFHVVDIRRYSWVRDSHLPGGERHTIPDDVFNLLADPEPFEFDGRVVAMRYPTRESAEKALSEALKKWAKEHAP